MRSVTIILPALVPAALLLLACTARQPEVAVNRVSYDCAEGKHFVATYYLGSGRADLDLEGRTLALVQQRSGSGIRYGDGRTTLFGKGNEAFIEADGSRTYSDCIARPH